MITSNFYKAKTTLPEVYAQKKKENKNTNAQVYVVAFPEIQQKYTKICHQRGKRGNFITTNR